MPCSCQSRKKACWTTCKTGVQAGKCDRRLRNNPLHKAESGVSIHDDRTPDHNEKNHISLLFASLVTAVLFPPVVCAQEGAASETPRSDKHYIGLLATALEHRSIGISKEDGWGRGHAGDRWPPE